MTTKIEQRYHANKRMLATCIISLQIGLRYDTIA